MRTLEERFWAKVDKSGPNGCWLWTGALSNGYGVIRIKKDGKWRNEQAHRVLLDPIPDGLEPDHLCRVRHCVNPNHIELVTHQINSIRGFAIRTHCPQGHEYTPENTRICHDTHRNCRQCANRYRPERYQNNKEKMLAQAKEYRDRNKEAINQRARERYALRKVGGHNS